LKSLVALPFSPFIPLLPKDLSIIHKFYCHANTQAQLFLKVITTLQVLKQKKGNYR
jgi:hypothetical protein